LEKDRVPRAIPGGRGTIRPSSFGSKAAGEPWDATGVSQLPVAEPNAHSAELVRGPTGAVTPLEHTSRSTSRGAWRRVWRLGASGVLPLSLSAGLVGCAGIAEQQTMLNNLHAQGQYQQAAAYLDEKKVEEAYGTKNRVLWQLDRGSLARTLDQPEQAITLLEEAERTIELGRQQSAGDVVGSWLVNDTVLPFQAEPYEDMYVNVIKLLANLELGRIDGGATVEARRLAGKANQLRDRYLQLADAVDRKAESSQIAAARGSFGGMVQTNQAGQFVESPLGTYLSALAFMKVGDSNFQQVAGRRLVDSLEIQKGLIGTVRTEDFLDLGTKQAKDVNVLVVALSGRGPTKEAEQIGPLAIASVPIYLELPKLREHPSVVTAARVKVDGQIVPGSELKLIEDLNAVATENHRRQMPLIYQKTLVRYLIKAGVTVGVTEGIQNRKGNRDDGWIRIVGGLVGLGVLMATEKADLRCWAFLPGQARVSTLKIEPGVHTFTVEYLADNGAVVFTAPNKTMTVTEEGLATGVFQYWR